MQSPRTSKEYLTESNRLMQGNRWDEQIVLMRDATRWFPDEPEFVYRLAAASAASAPADAIRHAAHAVALAPNDPLILGRCATLMFDLGELDLAERYVRLTIPVADDDFPLLADMLHLIGKLALQKANYEVAERYLELAFGLEPGTAGHADFLATFLVKMGRFDEAETVIEQGLAEGADDRERLNEIQQVIVAARKD